MTPPSDDDQPRASAAALGVVLASLALLILLGSALRPPPGRSGELWSPVLVLATELIAVLLPALLWTRAQQQRALSALGLAAAPGDLGPLLLAGALGGAAWFWLSAVAIEPLSLRLFPPSPSEQAALRRVLLPAGGLRPLPLDLLGYALAPALCEEVLFRGLLLPVLLRALPPRAAAKIAALVVSALAFGAYHLTPAKLLPTAFLGLGFGLPRLFIPSLWPSIAAHLCNNALVIILVRRGLDDAPLPGWLAIGALLAAAIAAALITRVSVRNPGLR